MLGFTSNVSSVSQRTFVLLFCLAAIFSWYAMPVNAEDRSVSLLLGAYRAVGKDAPDIRTLYLEFQSTVTHSNVSEALVKKTSDDIQAVHEQYLAQIQDSKLKDKLRKELSLANTTAAVRTSYTQSNPVRNRYLFLKNDSNMMVRLEMNQFDKNKKHSET